jgi:DNA repair exonuclease SbcCD nuclease subunit
MRFLHLADLHLGFPQYGNAERFQDFGKALEQAVEYAIDTQVNAILIAGDLMHRATIDPSVYIQAAGILKATRERGIPVIAVEGNHDAARHRGEVSWLDALCSEGYLHLLRAGFDSDGCNLTRWDPQSKTGSYLDIGNVRFIGLQWSGAMAPMRIPEVAEAIRTLPKSGTNFTVLITHAGLEGELSNLPVYLTFQQLDPLKDCVDYLALGHIHKQYERRGWIYNPGCPEVFDMGETSWEKGWYVIEVTSDGQKQVYYEEYDHRPFCIHSLHATGKLSPAELYQHVETSIQEWLPEWQRCSPKPVVIIKLEGHLEFDRQQIDINLVKKMVQDTGSVLLCEVRDEKLHLPGVDMPEEEDLSDEDLELRVFQEVAYNNAQYAAYSEEWARTMRQVMQLSLEKRSFDDIFDALQAQVDQIDQDQNTGGEA